MNIIFAKVLRSMAVIGLAMALPLAANAAVVYENIWDGDLDPIGPPISDTVNPLAAKFSITSATTVNKATWWGMFPTVDDAGVADIIAFGWDFFITAFLNDIEGPPNIPNGVDGGVPGGFFELSATVTDSFGDGTAAGTAFLFETTLDVPLAMAAGDYWFTVADDDTVGNFVWLQATSGLASAQFVGDSWVPYATQRAFALYDDSTAVPEPASLALLGLGLAGLGFGRRRKA